MRPASRRSIHLARFSSRMLPICRTVYRSVRHQPANDDRVVITGIGLVTAIGNSRESVWQAIQRGDCGVQRLTGVPGIPDGLMLGATVDVEGEFPGPAQEHSALPANGRRGAGRCPHPLRQRRPRPVWLLDRRPHGRHRLRRRAALAARQADPAGQRAVVATMAAEHGLFDGGERLRPARPAAEQLDGVRQRHDRHLEGSPRDSGRPVRHRARRQLRSDSSAVCRRFLQHGRAGRPCRSDARPAGRSMPIAPVSSWAKGPACSCSSGSTMRKNAAPRSMPKCSAAGSSTTPATSPASTPTAMRCRS